MATSLHSGKVQVLSIFAAAATIAGLAYFKGWFNEDIDNDESDDESGSDGEEEAYEINDNPFNNKEENNDNEIEKDASEIVDPEAELKLLYESALKEALEKMNKEDYNGAADKWTECIDLSSEISTFKLRDKITLYNNRSGMYQRAGRDDLSLTDIDCVLALSPLHLKSRARRAKIYERQGHMQEALFDYAVLVILESGPTSNGVRSDAGEHAERQLHTINKQLAMKPAMKLYSYLNQQPPGELKRNSLCKELLEKGPTFHSFSSKLKSTTKSDLLEIVDINPPLYDLGAILTILDLAWIDIISHRYADGFDTVKKYLPAIRQAVDVESRNNELSLDVIKNIAELLLLSAIEMQLRSAQSKAVTIFEEILELVPDHFESQIRLASCLTEMRELSRAKAIFDPLLERYNPDNDTDSANIEDDNAKYCWLLIFRSTLYKTKTEEDEWIPDCIECALKDANLILTLTEGKQRKDMVTCRLLALILSVEMLRDFKPRLGQVSTEEDKVKIIEAYTMMTEIAPEHDTVKLLGIDRLTDQDKIEEALSQCDTMIKDAEEGNGIPYIMKANVCSIMLAKAINRMEVGDTSAIPTAHLYREQVMDLYQKTLKVDPNSMEALIQLAHVEGMLGNLTGLEKALELMETAATKLANRPFEEVVDVVSQRNHLRVFVNAFKFVSEQQQKK